MNKDPSLSTVPATFDVLAFLADLLADDLDTDPFAQCEQDLLDHPPGKEFPVLDEEADRETTV